MTDTEKNAVLALARALVDADAGKSTLPPAAIDAMRQAFIQAEPICTPAQIANGTCTR